MRKLPLGFLLLVLVLTLAACAQQVSVQDNRTVPSSDLENTAETTENTQQPASPDENNTVTEDQMEQETKLVLSINGNNLHVSWENNNTVDELIAYAQNENIVVDTMLYGGFEQVGSLPQEFSCNDVQMTTEPGDIVLYSGNQLVVFFGSNAWSYTMLGHIEGLSEQALSELLGEDTAVIEIGISR